MTHIYTKMNIYIQNWISNEEEIKLLREKLVELRENQNNLEQTIIKKLKDNNLDNNIIKMNDKKIKIKSYKSYSNITNKYLMDTFTQFMDKDNSNMLLEYIRENRPYKNITELKLIDDKNQE